MHLVTVALALVFLATGVAVQAQPAGTAYRIGVLGTFPPRSSEPISDAFVQGLREHGYVEGRNLHIERRFSEGKADRLPALAADLVRLGVSLIVTSAPEPESRSEECHWNHSDCVRRCG